MRMLGMQQTQKASLSALAEGEAFLPSREDLYGG